jgi:hypothetical protein
LPAKVEDFSSLRDPNTYTTLYFNRKKHPRIEYSSSPDDEDHIIDPEAPGIGSLQDANPQLSYIGAAFVDYISNWETVKHTTWELWQCMISDVSNVNGLEEQNRRRAALRWLSQHGFLEQCDIHWAILSALAPWKPPPPAASEYATGKSKKSDESIPRDELEQQSLMLVDDPATQTAKLNAPVAALKRMISVDFFPLVSIREKSNDAAAGLVWMEQNLTADEKVKIPSLIWQLNDTAMGSCSRKNQEHFCEAFFPSYSAADGERNFWIVRANHNRKYVGNTGKIELWLSDDFVCVIDGASGRAFAMQMIDHY